MLPNEYLYDYYYRERAGLHVISSAAAMVATRTATTTPAVRRIRFRAAEVVIGAAVAGPRKP